MQTLKFIEHLPKVSTFTYLQEFTKNHHCVPVVWTGVLEIFSPGPGLSVVQLTGHITGTLERTVWWEHWVDTWGQLWGHTRVQLTVIQTHRRYVDLRDETAHYTCNKRVRW